tara:strand:+ start:350 stop:1090 length:741 start_codon:yes stop_codon:yes gene_type:complete
MGKIANILYSHTDYDDCWKPFFGQFDEMCKYNFDNYYMFSDDINEKSDAKYTHIAYNNNDDYAARVLHCLRQVDEDYVLFSHEDFILYDQVDLQYFQEAVDLVESGIDFVRLLKTGSYDDVSPMNSHPYNGSKIFKKILNSFDYIFAIQPTVWNLGRLIEFFENNQGMNIWELEGKGQSYCRQNNYTGLYTSHESEKKRGMTHWDSIVYPAVCTAIVKGKWNLSEYPELTSILSKYNIQPETRGCV